MACPFGSPGDTVEETKTAARRLGRGHLEDQAVAGEGLALVDDRRVGP